MFGGFDEITCLAVQRAEIVMGLNVSFRINLKTHSNSAIASLVLPRLARIRPRISTLRR